MAGRSKLVVFLIVLFHFLDSAGQNSPKSEFSILFYNVENLFDCLDDSLTADDEFTPQGSRNWTWFRFQGKCDRLAKVILAAGEWNPPLVIGLSEIENVQVLEYLTGKTSLRNFNYKIVHKDSPDNRGIDVALLYRREFVEPLDYQAIEVIDPKDKTFHTRDILRFSGVLNSCDTVHFFVNHWPSRYGGLKETERYRLIAANRLKLEVLRLQNDSRSAKIVCMGDFNDSPFDPSLSIELAATKPVQQNLSGKLINLSAEWQSYPVKTLKNQYTWEIFDQFIVTDYFLKSESCFRFVSAEIFKAGFLLEPDPKFGGLKPKRSYVGYSFQEGFSDHLPIVLRFGFN